MYRNHRPEISLFEDAKWALQKFATTYRLGAISDGYHETQKLKVAALGLEEILDPIIYSDAHGRAAWKPSPTPFQEFTKATGYEASECCYVGDNVVKDFVAANQLGWSTVHVVRTGTEYENRPAPPRGRSRCTCFVTVESAAATRSASNKAQRSNDRHACMRARTEARHTSSVSKWVELR